MNIRLTTALLAVLSLLSSACQDSNQALNPEAIEGIGGEPPGKEQPCVPGILSVQEEEGSGDEEELLCDRESDPEGCLIPDEALESQEETVAQSSCVPYPYPSFPQGKEQAVGSVSVGTLMQAAALPKEAPGFLKISDFRDRGYGTTTLVTLLLQTAVKVANAYPGGERFQVADLSAKNGGEVTLHASHENGTDADVFYFRKNRKEQHPDYNGFEENFVYTGSDGKPKLSGNFDVERNWAAMKNLVSSGKIGRIFADQTIKSAFCSYAKQMGEFSSQTETLRRIRHWPNHKNHFHVRIKCPKDSPRCIDQGELPAGSGC